MLILFLIGISFILLFVLGFLDMYKNQNYLDKIRIRVNVNGIRGKSTATRLISAIFSEAGLNTIGKTTGTAARFIIPAGKQEIPIKRPPEGPNIKEQMKIIKRAASLGAEALVCECMAVKPEYQDIYTNRMFKANATVIVNVLEDHLDMMGPSLDEVALAFSRTIPHNGKLVTVRDKYTEFFTDIAESRGTQVFIADCDKIPEGYLDKFDYVLFPDNVALGLACAEAFDIDHETALRGMLKARPDPGVLKITKLDEEIWGGAVFANGFAANEPASTLLIWKRLKENHSFSGEIVVLFNGRPDRVDRTKQFVNDFFPHLEGAFLIGMGQEIRDIQRAWENGKFPGISEYLHWENYSVDELLENIKPFIRNRLLFGVGNIHGDGEGFVERLLEPGESVPEQAEAVYKKDPWERSEEKATAKLASI